VAKSLTMVLTGDVELDQELIDIALRENSAKHINSAMRKYTRTAITEIVKPAVLELVPYNDATWKDDGQHLEDRITVRALKRSRTRVGYEAGFKEEDFHDFQGPFHYAGYVEYGWDHRAGFHVEADSFLRRALYPNASAVLASVRGNMAVWIAERNRDAR
jgi:hypothetical protein